MEILGLDERRMPALLRAEEPAGGLLADVARTLGLPPGIPVGLAVHDQYAAAIGSNTVHSDETMLGTGTTWSILAVTGSLMPPVAGIAMVGRHPVPGLFGQILSMVNGGSSLSWAARTLSLGNLGIDDMDRVLESAPPGSAGLSFWPLLSRIGGGALPPGTAGRLDGLRLDHAPAHVVRAVVEGLACELGRYLLLMEKEGLGVERLVMCGKAASSRVTPQVIADTTGREILCSSLAETTSLGAVVLARKLLEPRADLAALSGAMKPPMRRVCPGKDSDLAYERLQRYIAALPKAGS